VFDAKWKGSLVAPNIFMRSYPPAYHADLMQVGAKRLPGEEGICFGDAHPDNFGFIAINGKTKFVFNDLDDSGICPIAVDAARYSAVLHLYFADADLTADVIEHYVDTVMDSSAGEKIDKSLIPDMDKHRMKEVDTSTKNGKFLFADPVGTPTPEETAALTK